MSPLRRIAAGAAIIAQHKPFSLLSPSTAPRGNKRYARDLLTRDNLRGQWKRELQPVELPGLECAGRLDADSSGLLLWTDDSALAQHIIAPDTVVEKEYLVRIVGHMDWSQPQLASTLDLLREGISLDDVPLRPAGVKMLNKDQLAITLREGRHRQIRRMCAMVGLQVQALKRVRIGNLRLGGLASGYLRNSGLKPGPIAAWSTARQQCNPRAALQTECWCLESCLQVLDAA